MAEMLPENVSGYITGEGCFYVESGYDKKYRLKHRIRPAFCVEVRVDDKIILESVKKNIGCGNIYHLDFGRYKEYKNKNWRPHVKLRVSNFDDISEKIVPFFKKYTLFGTKQKSFEVFSSIVEKIQRKEHLKEDSLESVIELVRKLNELNKKGI
jgi:hypothetical protein